MCSKMSGGGDFKKSSERNGSGAMHLLHALCEGLSKSGKESERFAVGSSYKENSESLRLKKRK